MKFFDTSAIPQEIKKRIHNVVSRDVSNTRTGGVSVGALNRLIGIEGAELLYATDPESYIKELECLEKLLKTLDNIRFD